MPSSEALAWKSISILSTNHWPSWLPLLSLWFNPASVASASPVQLTVIAKNSQLFNLFGINRHANVTWRPNDLNLMTNSQLTEVLLRSDSCFFDGDLHVLL